MNKFLSLCLAGVSLMMTNGCAVLLVGGAAAAGAGTVLYVDGVLKDTENFSLETVHVAALAGVRDLQYAVINDTQDNAGHISLLVRMPDDKKIDITLTKLSPTQTEIRIRVGTFGDETLSRTILDKIKAHL
jgi:hypothetical protein